MNMVNKKLNASFTVEGAFIIPIFVFIIMALITAGFYARNMIMIKAFAWKEGIRLEQMTGNESKEKKLAAVSEDLKKEIRDNSVFLRNVNVQGNVSGDSETHIRVTGASGFAVPMFFSRSNIDITEKIKTNNPAASLRKWHGLQTIMNNEKGR